VPSAPSFKVIENNDSITIVVNKFISGISESSHNQVSGTVKANDSESTSNQDYLYYNIMNKSGVLDSYYVMDVTQTEVLTILKSDFQDGETLNVHFAGYSISVKL